MKSQEIWLKILYFQRQYINSVKNNLKGLIKSDTITTELKNEYLIKLETVVWVLMPTKK